jgi:hypothetical protein
MNSDFRVELNSSKKSKQKNNLNKDKVIFNDSYSHQGELLDNGSEIHGRHDSSLVKSR